MYTEQIKEIFKAPSLRLGTSGNLNPGVDFKFHTTYGYAGKSTLHSHEFYEVFLTIKGNIVHCVNKTVQVLEPGCLVFIRPDDEHGYIYNRDEKYEFVNLAMGTSLFKSMLDYIQPAYDCSDILSCHLPPVSRLTKQETDLLLKKLYNLNLVGNDNIPGQRLRIRSLILEIFCEYFVDRKNPHKTDIPLWLSEVCRLMKNPENFTLGQKRMAELCKRSPEHLSRTMKTYMKITPTEFINDLKINYAANLLANTDMKIADICYESGFGNISHFYTLFTKFYKVSPKTFRNTRIIEEQTQKPL